MRTLFKHKNGEKSLKEAKYFLNQKKKKKLVFPPKILKNILHNNNPKLWNTSLFSQSQDSNFS